ncbi:hypothetical protein LCGC14_0262730 [marine sediment metagenome]|uniref:Uncharacterized protein n=1 Tax=marine sediment metagenome TaxID=412755 RepID=A0A0F9U5X0_9ZZZZ
MNEMQREVIKRGTDGWWTWVAMLHVAKEERKRLGLSLEEPVTIDIEQCQTYVDKLNRNLLKRVWLLFTLGDLHPLDRDAIGDEVAKLKMG